MPCPKGFKRSDEFKLKISNVTQGDKNPHWRGGKRIKYNGYIMIYCPEHPACGKNKIVCEHRLVMEKHLGRYLDNTEIVHHINGNVRDNRIENLILYSGSGEHTKLHYYQQRRNEKQIRDGKGRFKKYLQSPVDCGTQGE